MNREKRLDAASDRDSPRVPSVLVVDDTIDNLRLLSDILDHRGYDVRAVTSGAQALLAAECDPPDLILLDINMPDMDGYEVCRRLKVQPASKNVPVIFLTALSETADKVKGFETGGVDHVTKPFQVEEVVARVNTHVALRQAQVALARSYARLQALEQLPDDLVHMIVHDMRSPLAALLLRLQFLRSTAATLSDEQRDDLRAAIQSAEGLGRMTDDLLDVSRLEAGGMPVECAACDLTQIARDVCAALASTDRERRIDVESAGPMEVTCDGALIRRIVENLVSNGIRHTPAGSRLRVSIDRGNGRARVAVHDEGHGVPQEARTKIFEKFGTLETRHGRIYPSVGVGLAFCKLAIEAQGGTIGVDSRVPVGSTFWFELPA